MPISFLGLTHYDLSITSSTGILGEQPKFVLTLYSIISIPKSPTSQVSRLRSSHT